MNEIHPTPQPRQRARDDADRAPNHSRRRHPLRVRTNLRSGIKVEPPPPIDVYS